MSKVSVVGVGMRNHPGVAAQFFQALSQINLSIHLVTTSEIKVSAIIEQKYLKKAVNHLHSTFHLDKTEGANESHFQKADSQTALRTIAQDAPL